MPSAAPTLFAKTPPVDPPAPAQVVGVGLDVSLTGTGVCVLMAGPDGDRHTLRTIATAPKDFPNKFDRIDHIVDSVQFLLPPAGPTVMVAVEKPFIHPQHIANNDALIVVGYMVRRMLTRNGYTFANVQNGHVKQFVAGTGAAKKADMQRDVLWRWGVRTADDNQADAAGLAHIARALWQRRNVEGAAWPSWYSDTIDKIERSQS